MSIDVAVRLPQPRPHQQCALDEVAAMFAAGQERVQLRMACGTGKTLIGPWLAQRLEASTVVVFTPSIALVAQILDEWRYALGRLPAMAVCSDPTTTAGRAEIGIDGVDPFDGQHDVAGKVTTKPGVVANFLDNGAGHLRLIVSTYHSAPVIADALRLADRCRRIDLVVCDEAHHLAGRTNALFLPALHDHSIRARRRLFMTATPVVLGNLSSIDPIDDLSGARDQIRCMDDPRLFGPVAYTLGVGDAITAGLLADYRVVVTTPAASATVATPERAALGALADVIERYQVRRVLTFHNRVAGAHNFARRVNALGHVGGRRVRGFAVDGSMPDQQRRTILGELADAASGRVTTVVSSSQCLREGVDVPAVDAVLFADPRTSQVGIIQAIGRALRTHPAKPVGTIVIPLVLNPDGDDQEQLAESAYAHVWRVLRGLRAHDARIGFDIDRARVAAGRGEPVDDVLDWLQVFGDDPGAVVARLLQRTSAAWEYYYGQLLAAAEKLGSAAKITTDSSRLGLWLTTQRILHRDGMMDADRARRLEAVPGWRWNAADAADERTLAVMAQVVADHGTVADHRTGKSIYAGRKDGLHRPLAFWVTTQLCKYRDGTLDDWVRKQLEALPGWCWEPLDLDDMAGFDAYRSFVTWEAHTDIPADHVEDDVPVGVWLAAVRRRRLLGALPPLLEAMLLAVAPTGAKGSRQLSWKPAETWWALAMDACQQFIARTGTLAGMPVGHTEVVGGHGMNLYGWVTRTRAAYHRGDLAPDLAAQAAQLEGWVWRENRGGRQLGEPLPGIEHGSRGYAKGCPCQICLDAGRCYNRYAASSRLDAYRADWVPAADVGKHLRGLLAADAGKDRSDACFTPGAIAAAAGVPLGLVRNLTADNDGQEPPRCHPLHRVALLALTPEDVQAARCVPRARGRMGIQGQREPVDDPEPIWRIRDELDAAGWMPQQLAAALGYASSASRVPRRGEPVSHAQAKMMRLLYESLDGKLSAPAVPPKRRKRRRDPNAEAWAQSLLKQGYQVKRVAARTGLSISVVSGLESATRGNR